MTDSKETTELNEKVTVDTDDDDKIDKSFAMMVGAGLVAIIVVLLIIICCCACKKNKGAV